MYCDLMKLLCDLKRHQGLDTTTLRRTATIVRHWGHVNDLDDFDASTVDGTDSRLTAVTWALNEDLHLTEAEVISDLSAVLSCHLSSVRRILLRATESHLTSGRPADDLTIVVGQRDDDVIKRRMDVSLTHSVDLDDLLLCYYFLCHINVYYLLAFFLFATVFFLPLRVRALFFVL